MKKLILFLVLILLSASVYADPCILTCGWNLADADDLFYASATTNGHAALVPGDYSYAIRCRAECAGSKINIGTNPSSGVLVLCANGTGGYTDTNMHVASAESPCPVGYTSLYATVDDPCTLNHDDIALLYAHDGNNSQIASSVGPPYNDFVKINIGGVCEGGGGGNGDPIPEFSTTGIIATIAIIGIAAGLYIRKKKKA